MYDVPPESDWFPVRITASFLDGGGKTAYTFQEVWLDGGAAIADKIGGRVNTSNDPAYAIDGSTFSPTAAGSNVQGLARRGPGAAGQKWELEAAGGSGPDATPTQRGWVNTTDQAFGGVKTFNDSIALGHGGVAGRITFNESSIFDFFPTHLTMVGFAEGISIVQPGGDFILLSAGGIQLINPSVGVFGSKGATGIDGVGSTFNGGICTKIGGGTGDNSGATGTDFDGGEFQNGFCTKLSDLAGYDGSIIIGTLSLSFTNGRLQSVTPG